LEYDPASKTVFANVGGNFLAAITGGVAFSYHLGKVKDFSLGDGNLFLVAPGASQVATESASGMVGSPSISPVKAGATVVATRYWPDPMAPVATFLSTYSDGSWAIDQGQIPDPGSAHVLTGTGPIGAYDVLGGAAYVSGTTLHAFSISRAEFTFSTKDGRVPVLVAP
jgi:hypothetical protein